MLSHDTMLNMPTRDFTKQSANHMAERFTPKKILRWQYDTNGPRIQRRWDTTVPGFGIELFKTGRKSWIYRYRFGGKQRIEKLADAITTPLEEAKERALTYAETLRQERDPKTIGEKDGTSRTVRQLFESYTQTPYFRTRSSDFQNNFPSTIKRYLLPAVGAQRPATVTRDQLKKIADQLIEEGKEGSARGFMTHAKILFRYAIDEGLITHSPLTDLRPKYTSKGRREMWLETPAALRQAWFINAPIQARQMVRWILLTGCRRDEARTAKWEDIQGGEWISRVTKNGRDLVLPITPMMRIVLDELRATFPTSPHIFPATTDEQKAIPRGSIDYIIRQATQGEWSLHVLRHSVESHLHELGVPEESRDLVLNHVRESSGAKYNHSTGLRMKREALQRWHNFLGSAVGDTHASPRYASKELEQADARLLGLDFSLNEAASVLEEGGAEKAAGDLRKMATQVGKISVDLQRGGNGRL